MLKASTSFLMLPFLIQTIKISITIFMFHEKYKWLRYKNHEKIYQERDVKGNSSCANFLWSQCQVYDIFAKHFLTRVLFLRAQIARASLFLSAPVVFLEAVLQLSARKVLTLSKLFLYYNVFSIFSGVHNPLMPEYSNTTQIICTVRKSRLDV